MKSAGRRLLICTTVLLSGCISAMELRPSYGVVVVYQAVPGSTIKRGIDAVSDEGKRLFGPSTLRAPSQIGRGGGTSGYGGMGVPKWVEVTWRTGDFIQRYDPVTKSGWTGGTIVARHRIEVAGRIPPEVLKYASEGKGRAVRLIFRIGDEGVLLGWDVQETYGEIWAYSLHGGDFPCDPVSPYATGPTCTSGYLKDAPWYYPPSTK